MTLASIVPRVCVFVPTSTRLILGISLLLLVSRCHCSALSCASAPRNLHLNLTFHYWAIFYGPPAYRRSQSKLPLLRYLSLMPLTEVSANVRRNGSHSQKPAHASSQSQSPNKVKPDAVSSMLRTSTETGDVGQFSARPSRVPRSASRIPTRRRSGSLNAPATSLRPSTRRPIPRYDSHRPPRTVPSCSALSRHDTVLTGLTSYHSNPRTRRRGASRVPNGFGRRPSPAAAMNLHSHPSFLTLPGRLGYRPVSPAVSDAHSMPAYSRAPGFHRAPSVATAASSPGSMFNRDLLCSSREVNNSTSSLSRFPSPSMPGAYPAIRRSPFPSRNATPVSAWLHNPTRQHNGSVESFHTVQRSGTGSTTPVYYDYTEAFEEYCQFPVPEMPISNLFSADHTIPEQEPGRLTRQAQTPFGMVEGSVFKPCEMPTQHNRTHSSQSKLSSGNNNVVLKAEQSEHRDTPERDRNKAEVSLRSAFGETSSSEN